LSKKIVFVSVKSAEVRLRHIRDACKESAQATLWIRDRRTVVKTEVFDFDVDRKSFRIRIPQDVALKEVLALISEEEGTYFNIKLHDKSIFFRTKFIDFRASDHFIEFTVPDTLFRFQLRRHSRYEAGSDPDIYLSHADPQHQERDIHRNLFDISAGGAALVMHHGEERYYHFQQMITRVKIVCHHLEAECWAVVRYIRVHGTAALKGDSHMGIEFKGLSETFQRDLSAYIETLVLTELNKKAMKSQLATSPKRSRK